MNELVKNWYCLNFDDILGAEINNEIDFAHLWAYMKRGCDFYVLIGVFDSLVRERIFTELAKRLGVKYDSVYYTWLNGQVDVVDSELNDVV